MVRVIGIVCFFFNFNIRRNGFEYGRSLVSFGVCWGFGGSSLVLG